MKSLLLMQRSNAGEWVESLRAALPGHSVLTSPAGDTAYAVVDTPAPGALASLRGLEVVFSVNAGVDALLAGGEVPDGIPIVRMADDGLAEGMLEWVLATTLAWHRNLFGYRSLQEAGRWSPMHEVLARDRRVCVLGSGHLGGRAAAALARIGFDTHAWSRSAKQIPGVTSHVGPDALQAAVTGSDFLINLLPLTPATQNLLDHRLLSRLAPRAVLINGGRGRHVVERAVSELLDSGRLRAAVLDVFREEPLPEDHPFWRHPGVYVTPHVAAPTHTATAAAAIAANIRAYEAGAPLRHVVDLGRGY